MTDKLRLEGVACRCRVGVPAEERRRRQRVELDAELALDLRAAGADDDLERSVDYHALERALRAAAESREFRLLEALAERAAAAALAFDLRIRTVTLAARKRPAVMPRTRAVAVVIERRRS